MYLGVHIPTDHKDDPDVSNLITSSRQSMKHFQIINALVSIAICFIAFANIVIFVMIYCVWIFEYCFFIIILNNSWHKKMYALKMQNGWIIESQQKKVYIDTRVSAGSDSTPISCKWHIAILVAEISAFIPYITAGDTRYRAYIFTFFICSLIVSAIALLFHIFINSNERNVYSKDTRLNQTVNTAMKKYKGIALILMSLLNSVAWIYMALSTYINGNYSGSNFFVYIFVQILTVFGLIIPLFLAQQRKKELLASDTAPIYVDDDEYWKSGYYYNPNDTHLFVENRIQSGNYTLNYAKKGAWIFSGATAALIIGCLIFVFAVLFPLINLKEEITLADNGILTISAGGYTSEIDVNDITELKLMDKLPDDSFLRINGASMDSYDIGRYEGRTFGKCSLYVFDGYSPILMIKTDDTLVFVNSKEDGEIERLYGELSH
ncbi:PH domain-containing protein [Agathobacter sp.]